MKNLRREPSSRTSALTAVSVACTGALATMLAFLMHEVLGHGLTAYLLNGRFLGFFVSPTAAFAETAVDEAARPLVLAAGTAVNLVAGVFAYEIGRRRLIANQLAAIALWQFAHISLVFQLLYVGGPPLGMWLSGQPPQGDWGVIFAGAGVHPAGPATIFIPLCVFAASALARDAARLTPWPHRGRRHAHIVAAYFTLVGLPLILAVLYVLLTRPWSGPREYFELTGQVITPLTAGLVGASIAQRRAMRREHDQLADPQNHHGPSTVLNSARPLFLMIAVLAGVSWLFGPTTVLRRGIAVQQPAADDYFRAAQDIRARAILSRTGRVELQVSSTPSATRGSPYLRRFTQHAAAQGPSTAAATEFTQFLSERNFGFSNVEISDAPRRLNDAWHWSGLATTNSGTISVEIWPAIYNPDSRVVEVELVGVELVSNASQIEGLTSSSGTVRWRRPLAFLAPVQFEVREQ